MSKLLEDWQRVVTDKASDLFLVAGGPICEKLEKRLQPISEDRAYPRDTENLIREIYQLAGRSIDRYLQQGDDDFSFSVAELARFRVNAYRQRGSMAAVVRVVSFEIPNWKSLGIPEQVMNLAAVDHGMVLVTGTAGSGKSTTQACVIDWINRTRECHIITLEDPIEYLHRDRKSIVSQREISIDTEDYPSALRACLRQAPDDHPHRHDGGGDRAPPHRHPAHQGHGKYHRPHCRHLPQRTAGSDSGAAEHGAAYRSLAAAAAGDPRRAGARL